MTETTLFRARGLQVLCAITIGLLAALLPARSQAEPSSSDWQWGATVYVWLPSMGGDTSFPPSGDGPAIDRGPTLNPALTALLAAGCSSSGSSGGSSGGTNWSDLDFAPSSLRRSSGFR